MGAHHEFDSLQKNIEVVADVLVDLLLRCGGRRDLGEIVGLGLILAVLNDAANLLLSDKRSLDPHRLVRSHRQEESVTLTHQLLGARLIQDDPRVGEAGGGKREPRRNVGLDEPGDDVDAGALGGQDEMNTSSPSELRDANDGIFNVSRGDHHQVGQLVHDHEEVGVGPQDALASCGCCHLPGSDRGIEVIHVPESEVRKVVVTLVHLGDDPLQSIRGLLRVGDDRGDQVRNTFVNTQLHSLGIHEDHAHFVRGCPHQYRCDQCINAARLTRTRGSRDEDVRHLGEVRNNELPLNVLA